MNLNFLTAEKLLETVPGTPDQRTYIPLIIMFGILIIGSISMFFFSRPAIAILGKTKTYSLSIGVLGLMHIFARYEFLPWLGSRWFLLVILLGLIIWVAYSLTIILLSWPKQKKYINIEEKYRQYLPKSSK